MTRRELLRPTASQVIVTFLASARSKAAGQTNSRPSHLRKVRLDNSKSRSGFSLIEVLIVVAIIGILAAIAYPSYAEYVKKTRRSDAHLALMSAAQSLERCKSTSFTYVGCSLPTTNSPEGYYTLELDPDNTASTFTIVASAAGVQANDSDCKTLTFNARGQKGATDSDDSASTVCWD